MERVYSCASPTGKVNSPPEAPQVVTDGRTNGNLSLHENRHGRASLHHFFRERTKRLSEQRRRGEEFALEHGVSFPSFGIIDHVRLSLLHPITKLDRDRLAANGFETERVTVRAKRAPRDHVYDPEPGAELLVRSSDGCRVRIWHNRIAVIGSLSRILGATNDQLHELTERDAILATRMLTKELLPWTTLRASLDGEEWAVLEIALAIDVPCDAWTYAEAYELSRWKPTNKLPKRYPRGLAWEGSENRLTLYDKGSEMIHRGLDGAPPPGTLMRVERQWQGARAIARLGNEISHGRGPSVALMTRHPQGGLVPLPCPIENRVLHHALARELSLLDDPLRSTDSRVDAFAEHMIECPQFHEIVRLRTDPKTYAKYRRRMLEMKRAAGGLQTLLKACYGALDGRRVSQESPVLSPF